MISVVKEEKEDLFQRTMVRGESASAEQSKEAGTIIDRDVRSRKKRKV